MDLSHMSWTARKMQAKRILTPCLGWIQGTNLYRLKDSLFFFSFFVSAKLSSKYVLVPKAHYQDY